VKYLSLFSGIGGFEIGINSAWDLYRRTQPGQEREHNAGVELFHKEWEEAVCVGYSDIDKYANKVYERNFNGHKAYGDITTINEKELPDFDTVVGGFPCQAFSVAGKRAGFDDTRGTLFFDIARILKEKKPKHLVLENVKGLLSHDKGRTLQTIIGVLSDLGYRVEWQVLNSKDFGVPQNRERIIIIGHLRDGCGRQVFPVLGTTGQDIKQLNKGVRETKRVYDKQGSSPTLNTMQGGGREPKIIAQRGRGIPLEQTYEPRKDDQTNTVTSVQKDNLAVIPTNHRTGALNQPSIRRLTPEECERLQGFPDDWTKHGGDTYGIDDYDISNTQRYKMCGNAVTTNVIEAVFTAMIERGCYE